MLVRSIKELRDRVGSVKNTKKITSAMKLVAAAKVSALHTRSDRSSFAHNCFNYFILEPVRARGRVF